VVNVLSIVADPETLVVVRMEKTNTDNNPDPP
jgi:hypothetical protein